MLSVHSNRKRQQTSSSSFEKQRKKKTIRFFWLWGFMGCRWNLDTTISAKVGAITVISHVKIPFLGLFLSSRAQLETGDVTHSQTPIRGEAGELTLKSL